MIVDSNDRKKFVKNLSRDSVPEGLLGLIIQFSRNSIQLVLRVARDVDALGQILFGNGLRQEFIMPHCPQKNGMVDRVI